MRLGLVGKIRRFVDRNAAFVYFFWNHFFIDINLLRLSHLSDTHLSNPPMKMEMIKRLFIVAAYASVLPVCIACGDRLVAGNNAATSSDSPTPVYLQNQQAIFSENTAFASHIYSPLSKLMAKGEGDFADGRILVLPKENDGALVFRPVAEFVDGTVQKIRK